MLYKFKISCFCILRSYGKTSFRKTCFEKNSFYFDWNYFLDLLWISGIFIKLKDQSHFSGSGSSDFSELTEAGRPGRSTGRAQRARQCALEVRSTEPVDRLRELCSREFSVDRTGRPTESFTLFSRCAVDRAGRPVAATVRNMTVGRSTGGRPTALTQPQRLYFSAAYKRGSCQLF